MRRQQNFLRAAQMRDALRRLCRQRRSRKPGDDFFQHGARGIRILRDFQMPVGQLRERGGDLFWRRVLPVAEMVERDFRAGQILQVLRLDAGEQRDAFVIIGKFRELLADFHDGFERMVQFPF